MYDVYGNRDAKDIIVAIPALGERKEMFQPLADAMDDYKWIVFDLPGSNQQAFHHRSIPAFCTYIQQTLDSLQIERAHFIGNSLGAWAIQSFTAQFPEYVRSLALLDGGHYFLGERQEVHEDVTLPSAIENFEDIQNAIEQLTYSMPNLEAQCYTHFQRYFLNNYIEQHGLYAHHCDEIAYNCYSKELSTVNYCLEDIQVPTILCIAGASADQLSLDKAAMFNEKFERADVHIIENGQHYLPLTNTMAVAEKLETYYRFCEIKLKYKESGM